MWHLRQLLASDLLMTILQSIKLPLSFILNFAFPFFSSSHIPVISSPSCTNPLSLPLGGSIMLWKEYRLWFLIIEEVVMMTMIINIKQMPFFEHLLRVQNTCKSLTCIISSNRHKILIICAIIPILSMEKLRQTKFKYPFSLRSYC